MDAEAAVVNGRVAVYTCVTGQYDPIRSPERVEPDADYFCFTDAPEVPKPWRRMPLNLSGLDARDQSRYVKMLPHRIAELARYDLSIYVDGSMSVVGDIFELIREVEKRDEDVFAYDHPVRNCVYAEGFACAHYGHAWIWEIDRQLRRYRVEGFPGQHGLFEAGVLVRRQNADVARFMETWWSEYTAGVRRDQLSFTYAAWRSRVRIGSLGRSDPRFAGRIFKFVPHPGSNLRKLSMLWPVNRLLARIRPYPALDRRAGIAG